MATKVIMPQLGEAVEEAIITKWLKSEGDEVDEFDALVEVNTDKVDTEIPAPVSGTLLKIVQFEEGITVEVGTILAWIGEPGETIPVEDTTLGIGPDESKPEVDFPPKITTPAKADRVLSSTLEQSRGTRNERSLGFISPVVENIAAEHRINLQDVNGTGLKGRITKKDLLDYIEAGDKEFGSSAPTGKTTSTPITDQSSMIPHSTIRRRIADHMVLSKQKSPHVTTVFEADMSKIVSHRSENKEEFNRDGVKLTFTSYFVAATALALQAFPTVNSSWTDDGLILHHQINIGMATSLGERGLIVPVIKNADNLSLKGVARCISDLANRARGNLLQPDEVAGGTFTITNHGVSGSLFAMPIINQPQSAILGVGKLQKRVIALEDNLGYDTIAVRPMVYLTLTFDHRILDGAIADYFLSKVVKTLENWT